MSIEQVGKGRLSISIGLAIVVVLSITISGLFS